jgi:hypothetical protein
MTICIQTVKELLPVQIRRIVLSAALFFGVGHSVSHVQAANLVLTYDGVTTADSSVNGTPIAVGTAYEIKAFFPDTLVGNPATGVGVYTPTAITAVVGGVSYSGTDISSYSVRFADPTYPGFPGDYAAALDGNGAAFVPVYTTATPPIVATAVTPTVFSDYNGFDGNVLNLPISGGILSLEFDVSVGVSASVSAASVPEPGSLVLAGIASLAGLGVWARRRHD